MTKKISPVFTNRQFDADGKVLSGGNIAVYIQGSATVPANIFADANGTSLTNPVTLDNGGLPPAIFLTNGTSYNLVLRDANGTVVQSFSEVLI